MKAVNLIPSEARRASGLQPTLKPGPAYGLLALLALAVLLVTVYVLSTNSISSRRAQLATLQTEVAQEQAQAARLSSYGSFAKLAQARLQTVRQIASSRFDWHAALADLSRVVPADTSLESLQGTVAPGASVSGAGGSGVGASAGALRGAIQAPAFELSGCTKTQDDVARLLSRLRLINGVQRVTLADSAKHSGTPGSAVAVSGASGSGAGVGCGNDAPTFDLVVFFQPLPGAAVGATPGAAANGAPASSASATPASTATSAPTTTTPGSARPVSNPGPTGGSR